MLSENGKRLFIAINLPDEVRAKLATVHAYFQHAALRWTPPQNLHITTHFIGMVQQNEVDRIMKSVSEIAGTTKTFTLSFAGLQVISKKKKPVMVWAAFEQSSAFVNLALQLQQALPGDDSKAPVPHVTLARIKEGGPRELPALPSVEKFSISVHQIELWESQLGSGSPVYSVIEKFALG